MPRDRTGLEDGKKNQNPHRLSFTRTQTLSPRSRARSAGDDRRDQFKSHQPTVFRPKLKCNYATTNFLLPILIRDGDPMARDNSPVPHSHGIGLFLVPSLPQFGRKLVLQQASLRQEAGHEEMIDPQLLLYHAGEKLIRLYSLSSFLCIGSSGINSDNIDPLRMLSQFFAK
ncbi:hypothetical protein K440DRAFT_663382 [Wilcoxina mikolae CBS 423.85]|nr:hypothetical protein K440DRAFT_663382 [Wilcoxina mikolae CBS 423.85]